MKYVVTASAGAKIGIFKNPGAGAEIEMTAEQAEHPLRCGYIAVPIAPALEEAVVVDDASFKVVSKSK